MPGDTKGARKSINARRQQDMPALFRPYYRMTRWAFALGGWGQSEHAIRSS
jgi:hypothetical protein